MWAAAARFMLVVYFFNQSVCRNHVMKIDELVIRGFKIR